MNINMLFFTISIKKSTLSREDYSHQEKIKQWHEENLDRTLYTWHNFSNKNW